MHELGQLIHSERDVWSGEGEVWKTSQNPFVFSAIKGSSTIIELER